MWTNGLFLHQRIHSINIYSFYNSPNNFFGLSLDKTDQVSVRSDNGYEMISKAWFDIRRLILFRQNKGKEMSMHSN